MKKLISVLTALILATSLTACSDDKEKEISTVKTDNVSNTVQDTVTTDKKINDTSSIKKNFISSCVLGSGIADDALIPQITQVCECTYDGIIETQGMTEFIRVDMEMRKNGSKTVPAEWKIDELVAQCVTKLEG